MKPKLVWSGQAWLVLHMGGVDKDLADRAVAWAAERNRKHILPYSWNAKDSSGIYCRYFRTQTGHVGSFPVAWEESN